uniref:ATP synthase F0 subunit 8 n=1 Tax=Proterops sp. QL-2014 TaxID=1491724 RepID=A0A0U1WEJ4_9HYME|nr:ATP synthase F0 subunit 8 [Proterops sp. QL-2014]
MPQMSPMDWYSLMIYFFLIYLLIMIFIYYMNYKKLINNKMKMLYKFNFKWY